MDVDKLKAILAALEGTDVTRITWSEGTETIDLRLGHPPSPAMQAVPVATAPVTMAAPMTSATPPSVAPVPAAAPPPAGPAAGNKTFTVNSPFVGTFYRSASPDSPSFVDVGQVVKKGQVLCIVEAMKLMNEIEAEQPGRLVEVLIQNGSPVEYGEVLFRFELV
ncbi:MAG: acetyl-CoA carboxylase biotin carboxyl carrier protein [Deltaproteobacteria bacterium]|nr:MAG: acetyl-CoA carboxylase biotin carboxyl carrier protein [Deltaproteobacteria bacterium]